MEQAKSFFMLIESIEQIGESPVDTFQLNRSRMASKRQSTSS